MRNKSENKIGSGKFKPFVLYFISYKYKHLDKLRLIYKNNFFLHPINKKNIFIA